MGVIRNLASLQNGYSDSIEDVLNEIEEQIQNYEPENRRVRRVRHRSRPQAIEGPSNNARAKSGKKKKRIDNFNYLLSLADPEEAIEISIHDFIPPSASVFSQICFEWENMEMWNEFVNCTDVEACLKAMTGEKDHNPDQEASDVTNGKDDKRLEHPAYSASECFKKIDNDLRCLLRRKHVPMGPLTYLERELVTFFVNRPHNIYHSHIPNSFERLLLHGLCQYMDLSALSYDRGGARWTRVKNNKDDFVLPSMLLSTYLELRIQRKALPKPS